MTSCTIFTTVAYHPKGLDLHHRNLQWALNCPITIFSFKENSIHWNDRPFPNTRFIYSTIPPDRKLFDFHGELLPHLIRNTKSDVVLFMQQDIILTRKIHDLVGLCHENQCIVMGEIMPYFSIYDRHGKITYPRLWEGALLYPTQLLIDASEKISLGFHVKNILQDDNPEYDSLKNDYLKNPFTNDIIPIDEWLKNPPLTRSEKLFELTMYCKAKSVPYRVVDPFSLHFQGPEKTHRLFRDVYQDLSLLNDPLVHPRSRRNCAFLYYLSGATNDLNTISKVLADHKDEHYPAFRDRIIELRKTAKQWMTSEQYNRYRSMFTTGKIY